MRLSLLAIVSVVLAVILAACGGGSGAVNPPGGGGSGVPLEFVATWTTSGLGPGEQDMSLNVMGPDGGVDLGLADSDQVMVPSGVSWTRAAGLNRIWWTREPAKFTYYYQVTGPESRNSQFTVRVYRHGQLIATQSGTLNGSLDMPWWLVDVL